METDFFEQTITHLHTELNMLRTNRATPAMVEDITVLAYNTKMSLQELASITTPEAQTLAIQPWDKSLTKAIESALRESDMQLNPVVDGEMIRIFFAPLTQERRKELVKVVHEKGEEARIAIRRTREELIKNLKAQEKTGTLSEDEYFRQEKEVQKMVDTFNEKVQRLTAAKEKEIMTI
ncbi:MAG: ribosome recycling factor [Candidatus Kerfeldbacteria bacterium]|nr:ribosome recycling factor [Candidatus Kerfeldbacteria bacterium]